MTILLIPIIITIPIRRYIMSVVLFSAASTSRATDTYVTGDFTLLVAGTPTTANAGTIIPSGSRIDTAGGNFMITEAGLANLNNEWQKIARGDFVIV